MGGYVVDSSDKLRNIKDHTIVEWNFQCPYCQSKNLIIHPLGVPFRYHTLKNDDVNQEAKDYYKSIPNIAEAVIMCVDNKGEGILIECKSCKQSHQGFKNGFNEEAVPNKTRLKRYLNNFYNIQEEFEL